MLNIETDCWLNVVISWVNFLVFSLSAFEFYKYYRGTCYFLLPFTIINITAAIALTLLLFCLSDLQRMVRTRTVIVAATPSVLVIMLFAFFVVQQAVNWMFFYT
ncbi:hypothetical protein [Erwinia sp.]|uniref:hypothetical protein n=1 Tax=Erwinia citreus TaxID=558 RepID=UPI00289E06C6|nr:hypothetical protein [Erwinia sp.]